MLVDLVQTTTRDGLRLDGAWQAPRAPGADALAVDAFVLVHGTGGSFYSSTLFDALTPRLLSLGVGVLRVNTRGHDLVSTASAVRGGVRQGAAYEILDDCRHDLAAWMSWLQTHAGPRVGLLGHSSGALKCLYTQAHQPELPAACVVAVSPPRLSHSAFAASAVGPEFLHTIHHARALVEAGQGSELLDVRLPLPFLITASGYVEKYGPDERYNYLSFVAKLSCPLLVTFGSGELASNPAFAGAPAALEQALAGQDPTIRVIEGADHFYTGSRDALAGLLEGWLRDRLARR